MKKGEFYWVRLNEGGLWIIGEVTLGDAGDVYFFIPGYDTEFQFQEFHEVGARIMPPE